METASIRLICFYDGDLINEKNAEYDGGKKKLSKVSKTISFKEFKEKIQAMLGLQPDDSEFTIKCGVYLNKEIHIAIDVDDDESLSSIMDQSEFIMAYIIKRQPSVIKTHQREANGLPNVEKETIGGGGVVDPPNEMNHCGNFLQPMDHPLSSPCTDANMHGCSNFEPPCVNYTTSNQTPLHGNKDLAEGQDFPDADAFRHALSDLAIRTNFEYKPVKTTKYRLTMKCKSPECKWRIVAGVKDRKLPAFKVTTYRNRHSCPVRQRGQDHDQATAKWIAAKIQSDIKKNRDMTPSDIITKISGEFDIQISYNKAAKAKTKALEEIAYSSSFEESYLYLPGLIKELEKSGCVTKLGCDKENGFLYFFWAFRQRVQAFHSHLCPPLIEIKSKRIQSGVLMIADSIVEYSQLYLAFAIFKEEEENEVCWETFLMLLKEFILADVHLRLPFAIVTEFDRRTIVSLVSKVFPEVHHVFKLASLSEDFSDKFKDVNLRRLMFKATEMYNVSDCDRALNEIKEKNEDAYQWLLDAGKPHWSTAYFQLGYDVNCRSLERWFHIDLLLSSWGWCQLPIAAEVIHITKEVGKAFLEQQDWAATLAPTELNSYCRHRVRAALRGSDSVQVATLGSNAEEYHAFDVTESHNFTVNLETRRCDCGEFQVIGIPCKHAAAVIKHLDLNIEDYCKHWHKNEAIRAIFAEDFLPLANLSQDWQPPEDNEPRILPPKMKVGRPRKAC